MPAFEDGTPGLGEIARMLTDFRNEWRQGVQELVRKDVYTAHLATMETKLANLETKLVGTETKIRDTEAKLERAEQAKGTQRNLLYGTALAAGVSLIGWVLTSIVSTI